MLHDVFICHASEDKDEFVRPLAQELRSKHIDVWYDEFSLSVGDSLREAIDKGLSSSRFGIVVLSPHFFEKRWTKRELNGLVAREIAEDRQLILPIWHEVSQSEVVSFSPPLADLVAATTSSGMQSVVDDLSARIRPEDSPLIIARDFLIKNGEVPPVITDEWWLDLVEVKEADFLFPNLNHNWHWIFPLPYPKGHRGKERGLNIAWTSLQLDWSAAAKEQKICQLTHPEKVHSYIKGWPGLHDCCARNPSILALYAPQLTIPGYDIGFEKVFDNLLSSESKRDCEALRYGRAETTDNQEPLCGDFIAWRHHSFGNYTSGELSYQFATAHNGQYSRAFHDNQDCLVWLLSSESSWLPKHLGKTLTEGFKQRVNWWLTDIALQYDAIGNAIWDSTTQSISYSRTLKEEISAVCDRSREQLGISDSLNTLTERFIECAFLEGFLEEKNRIEELRARPD